MVRLVLFDIDGTLIRTGGAGVRAFDRTGELEFGIKHGTAGMQFAGRTDTSLVRQFFTKHGVPATQENFDRFFRCYLFLLEGYLRQGTGQVCPGVHAFLNRLAILSPQPLVGLLTGNIKRGAEIKLRHFNLWHVFAMGAFGDDHEDRNELAKIAFERGARLLGGHLQGCEVLVVGDTPADIDCARAIGAKVLALSSGGADHQLLARHNPDWLERDLSNVNAEMVCGQTATIRAGLEGRTVSPDTNAQGGRTASSAAVRP